MPNQSHGASIHREPAGAGAVPSVAALRIVLVSPGVYALADSGAPAAAIVEVRPGVYAIDTTTTTGDLKILRTRTTGVLY